MARTRFQPEREKPEPRYGKGDEDFRHAVNIETPPDDSEAWEFASIANFCEHMAEEERITFTTDELVALAARTGVYNTTLRQVLESKGLKLVGRTPERKFATFGTNQHDRWTCEESRRMNGGGGGDSLIGIAGRVG
jgi:hypothetical protein